MKVKTEHKLKPCPFCGGQAITQEMRYSMLQSENFVKCVNCGAESSRYYDDMHSAIKLGTEELMITLVNVVYVANTLTVMATILCL